MKNIITYLYKFSSRLALSALMVSYSFLPAQAYGGPYSDFDNQSGLRNSVNAGFRLTIPFGPTKKSEDKVKYGFQLNLRREYNNSGWNGFGNMNRSQTFNADILSLDFSENGFKGLSLAGQQAFIYKNSVLMATEGEGGSNRGWYIAGGVVLVIVGGAALAVIAISNDIKNRSRSR